MPRCFVLMDKRGAGHVVQNGYGLLVSCLGFFFVTRLNRLNHLLQPRAQQRPSAGIVLAAPLTLARALARLCCIGQ